MIVDGWLHTGDIAFIDDDGYVHVVDRKKDMIKSGGHGVWPREVEEVLAAHPDIVEVGVTGVPSPRYGESVKAFVVLRPGAALSADDVIAWSRDQLASYRSRARSSSATSCEEPHRQSPAPAARDRRLGCAALDGPGQRRRAGGRGTRRRPGRRSSSATAC